MDFTYLLELAKENDKSNKNEASKSKFSTNVGGAKKLNKASPNVGAIKALLEKKDVAKARQKEEFIKKRDNLLALRAQDRKSNQRVSAMINRTKGASKAVLDDAKDLTTACGEEQCDEDDYGYESTMSQQIFSKLANRYANLPDDDKMKFVKSNKKASIDDIKKRVINTLKKEEEDDLEPRRKKRRSRHQDDDFINDGDAFRDFSDDDEASNAKKNSQMSISTNINLTNYKSDKHNNFKYDSEKEKKEEKNHSEKREKEKEKKKKSKPSAPPPMSFMELMKVAKQKQTGKATPVTVDTVVKEKKDKEKKKEIDRPMTAKEKEDQEDERRRKIRRMKKEESEKSKKNREVKKNGELDKNDKGTSKLQQALEKPKTEPKTIDKSKYFAVPGPRNQPVKREEKPSHPPPRAPPMKGPPPMKGAPPMKGTPPMKGAPPKGPPSKGHPPRGPPPVKAKPAPPSHESISRDRKMPQKSRDFPPRDMKPPKQRDLPPPKAASRPFPPADVRRPKYAPPPPRRGRIESDSEEEYDSEMDDFIDDGEEELDYSSEIKRMFGYDKSRYADEDDDCDDMEASFSQMQKEERISAKLGLKEDLEDIRREEEEKKRKMMKMKQLKKHGRR